MLLALIPVLALMTMAQQSDPHEQERSFEFHGIVEGFYGQPWSHEARVDMIRFMGEVGFNTFFYAPKDDPYHRSRWREPYPADALARFRELFETAQAADVVLYYAISPGLSIEYSSDERL
jgi:hyaluronoglucosaminidase